MIWFIALTSGCIAGYAAGKVANFYMERKWRKLDSKYGIDS